MRICVPTETDDGLNATVSAHFGRAPFFAFVDSTSKQVEFVANRETGHDGGRCRGAALAVRGRPEAVAASGMGKGAFDLLRSQGAHIYLSRELRLEGAVDSVVDGTSPEMSEAMGHHHQGRPAQGHHGERHGHGADGCCGEPGHNGRHRQ